MECVQGKKVKACSLWSDLYRTMLRIRCTEERIATRYTECKMRCPIHLSIGQEAVAAGVCHALKKSDIVFSHRSEILNKFDELSLGGQYVLSDELTVFEQNFSHSLRSLFLFLFPLRMRRKKLARLKILMNVSYFYK